MRYTTGILLLTLLCQSQLLAQSLSIPAESVPVEDALLKTIESTKVAAEVAGKLEKLLVVEGTQVQVDQPLGKIRDSAVNLQLERAKIGMATARKKQRSDIDLRLAEKRAAVAQNELQRAESANNRIRDTYAPKEVDRLRLVAESAALEVERAKYDREIFELDVMLAENEFRQAEELMARHQILSPVLGVVVAVNRRVGEWVEPGMELLQIVKIDRLRVEGFVSGAAANRNLLNSTAQVNVLRGDNEVMVEGRVVFVNPDANPINGQVRVYLEIDNTAGEFRPGMRVKADIRPHDPQAAPAPAVDKSAAIAPVPRNSAKP
ncbi:MAG: HlyD family efflux transporter periplasmic adaptor subunit [Pirellulaceae bacterium]